MSDHRITGVPTPGNSHHITTGVLPTIPGADWPSSTVPLPKRLSAGWLCVRVVGTVAVAAVFVCLCWLMCDNADPNVNMFAGPVLLLRWRVAAESLAVAMIAGLLACIFAVGVRLNAVTFYLSVLGCVAWYVVGLYVVGMSV